MKRITGWVGERVGGRVGERVGSWVDSYLRQNISKQNSVKVADVTFDWLEAEPKILLKAVLATSTLRADFPKCRRKFFIQILFYMYLDEIKIFYDTTELKC